MKRIWERVVESGGRHLSESQLDLLNTYRDWLGREAIPGGGLGPEEGERLEERHIADSLLFSIPLENPDEIWDLGTGVGLPGIPLAIVFNEGVVNVVDRSRRRLDLVRRAIRVLDLDNVEVVESQVENLVGPCEVIVSRACLSPTELYPIADRLLVPGGVAILGGSWLKPPQYLEWETVEVGGNGLDRSVWLLIMRRQ